MNFINPLEILDLKDNEINSIDNIAIKKAKRKLFADIDLSEDCQLHYKDIKLTKSFCERAIDELENNEKKEFYSYLLTNEPLNNFLTSGNELLFSNFKQEAIYKLDEFINFISPYYSTRFDRSITNAFKKNNIDLFRSILRTQFLINKTHIGTAFKSLSNELQHRIEEVDKITNEIKNEETDYTDDDIEEVIGKAENYFPVELLNSLPPYFQSQINKIASSLNYLSIAIWNEFSSSFVPMKLLETVLTLNLESVSKPTFQKNYSIYQKKYEEQVEEERNAPVLIKWAEMLIKLRDTNDKIEAKTINPKQAQTEVNSVNIEELNRVPSFGDEIRKALANVIRGISISIWNKHSDIDTSIRTLNKALAINLSSDEKNKLLLDLKKLNELKKETELRGEPISSAPDIDNFFGIGAAIYGDTYYFIVLHIPVLPIARYNCEQTFNGYRFFGKLKLHKWQKIWQWALPIAIVLWIAISSIINSNNSNRSYSNNDAPRSYTTPESITNDNTSKNDYTEPSNTYLTPIKTESEYKGNQLSNGASPFDRCFGKGKYSGQAWIKFDNSNSSDAIVNLVNVYSEKVIRNEYIKAGSTYKMSNVPSGTYYLKVYYGNDWNPTKTNFCGTLGAFDSEVHFSKSDNPKDYIEIVNGSSGYSTWTITLYSVLNGNMATEPTNESDFFKN